MKRSRQRGFTLIELLVVAAIIAIVSAMAIPRYASSLANYRATAVSRRIAADIQFAQTRARALSTTQTVTFSVAQNSYQVTGYPDPDHPSATYSVPLADQGGGTVLVSATFGAGSTLEFNGYGVPTANGVIQIQSGQAQRTITVSADTGAVTVQ